MTTAEVDTSIVDAALPEIDPDEIAGDFVPRPSVGVATYPLGSEAVLIGGRSGPVQHLDQIAAIVWSLFDGETSLDVLADDLAAGFQHDRGVIFDDVLNLTRNLGTRGMVAGVALPRPKPRPQAGSIEPGEPLPDFTYLDADGVQVSLADLQGRRAVILNWSARCGYCVKIAAEIGELAPKIADAGADLVFIAPSDGEGNRELLTTHNIPARLLVKGSEIDGADPFPGMGTPMAYLIDEAGVIAEPLAAGAGEVPVLLRTIAGVEAPAAEPTAPVHDHDHDHDHDGHDHGDHDRAATDEDAAPRPKFIPMQAGGGVCGPGATSATPTVWEPAHAYQVGDYYIGIQANTPATDALLARVLAPVRNDDLVPPANYSLLLAGDGDGADGVRGLNMLLSGAQVLVRSRSEARVIHALLQYLSTWDDVPTGMVVTDTVVGIRDGQAVLLPRLLQSKIKELQPRLSRAGIATADTPFGVLDLVTREVVVPEVTIAYDDAALADVPDPAPRGSELARVLPGRYPLAAWYFSGRDTGVFSDAAATAHALSQSRHQLEEPAVVAAFAEMFGSIDGVGVGLTANDEMVAAIAAHIAG